MNKDKSDLMLLIEAQREIDALKERNKRLEEMLNRSLDHLFHTDGNCFHCQLIEFLKEALEDRKE